MEVGTRHIIIGYGNLGHAIHQEIKQQDHRAKITIINGRSENHLFPEHVSEDTTIWVTAGFGSIKECSEDPAGALTSHVALPVFLLNRLPKNRMVFFSTDYCASESLPNSPASQISNPKSFYAFTKCTMESAVFWHALPRKAIVRITTLHGQHRADKNLSVRIRENYSLAKSNTYPSNMITPTPAAWIAKVLWRNQGKLFTDQTVIEHCAPQGAVSVYKFAQMVLGPRYTILQGGIDQLRPKNSRIGCTLEMAPDWKTVWNEYFPSDRF